MTNAQHGPRTLATCGCRCHRYGTGSHVTCDAEHDTGSSGVPGVPSCSPHDLTDDRPAAGGDSVDVAECPGSCNREWRRLTDEERQHPDQPIKAVLGDPVWCRGCSRRIDRALQDFPDLYVGLEADFAMRSSQPGEGSHTKRFDAPSPSPQVDEQLALASWLTNLEDLVRAGRDFTPRPNPRVHGHTHTHLPLRHAFTASVPWSRRVAVTRLRAAQRALLLAYELRDSQLGPGSSEARKAACHQALRDAEARIAELDHDVEPQEQRRVAGDVTLVRVTRAAEFVRGNLDWLLASEWATEKGAEVLRYRGRLRSFTATDSGTKHRTKPCPRCGLKMLREHAGEARVECQHCGRLLTVEEYDQLGVEVAS